MLLKELLKDAQYTVIKGNIEKEVKDICYNSKEASSDKAFVAISGFIVDGHDYINDALDKGCKVIILENDKIDIPDDVTIIKLDNTRIGLSKISRTLFGYPDKELTTVAITGTKGKTTTSWIVKEILNLASLECGYIGTIGVFYKDKGYDTVNTTPEAYDVFKYMREMINNGVKYLAMEVTSQALKLERFPEVMFDYGVFTNLSLDHVGKNEHESYEEYVYCKSKLFKQCKIGIFNSDDKEYKTMVKDFKGDIYTFGTNEEASLRLVDYKNIVSPGFRGIEIATKGSINDRFKISSLGYFNAYNALCAISICYLLGVSLDDIKNGLSHVYVKGRMNQINISDKFDLFIDEAYQGVAMENVLKTIKETNPKRIVAVFGCGGNRSKQRRYDCGEVASKYADLSILTADNPRYEDNNDIINDILVGMKKNNGNYIIIPDRREAIKYSIVNAQEGDVILILGRGAEEYQEINGVRSPFNDEKVVREIVNNLKEEYK